MRFKAIVVPVDGSAPSDAAVDLAVAVAKADGARLTFCHVVHVPLPIHDAGGFAREQLMQDETTTGKSVLDAARNRAAQAGIQSQTELLSDPLVDAVLDMVKEKNADLIVMGSRGRGALARAVMGSKTADVIARSHVPVLVAPHINNH
jgi:nucleotide-binding universal stress UspA family protein